MVEKKKKKNFYLSSNSRSPVQLNVSLGSEATRSTRSTSPAAWSGAERREWNLAAALDFDYLSVRPVPFTLHFFLLLRGPRRESRNTFLERLFIVPDFSTVQKQTRTRIPPISADSDFQFQAARRGAVRRGLSSLLAFPAQVISTRPVH